ncbi:MAG: DUF4352 domain-containing protein [Halorientalis sp.]
MPSESLLTRRRLLQSSAAAGAALLAGCGETTPGTPTPGATGTPTQDGTATPGDGGFTRVGVPVGNDEVAMMVSRASLQQQFAGRRPADGNRFVVCFFTVKNRTADTFLPADGFESFTLETGGGQRYERRSIPVEPAMQFQAGLVAPGEVVRGYVVFEAPADVSEPVLDVDLDFEGLSRDEAQFALSRRADDVASIEQSLSVPVHDVGESVTGDRVSVAVTDFRTTDSVGDVRSGEDTTFAIPSVRVRNDTDEDFTLVVPGPLLLKNARGEVFTTNIEAQGVLENPIPWNVQVPAGEHLDGDLPFTVPTGVSPLYFVADLHMLDAGDRYFWQVA